MCTGWPKNNLRLGYVVVSSTGPQTHLQETPGGEVLHYYWNNTKWEPGSTWMAGPNLTPSPPLFYFLHPQLNIYCSMGISVLTLGVSLLGKTDVSDALCIGNKFEYCLMSGSYKLYVQSDGWDIKFCFKNLNGSARTYPGLNTLVVFLGHPVHVYNILYM